MGGDMNSWELIANHPAIEPDDKLKEVLDKLLAGECYTITLR